MLALRWSPCLSCAGVIASIMHTLLPALRRHCAGIVARESLLCPVGVIDPCLPCVTTSIANLHLPSPHAIATQHLHPHCAGVSAGIALVFLPASRWLHCQHCTVIVTGAMLLLSPSSRGYLPPVALAFSPLLPLASLPAFQTGVCPVPPQSQHIGVCGIVAVSLSLLMALLPSWHHSTATWPSMVRPMQHWCLCRRCTCVLARMLLASLQASCCCCCQCCAGVVALAARASWLLSCWRRQSRCTHVAASIANWRPLVTTQLRPVGVRDVVAVLFVIARGPLPYLESSTATGPLADAVLASLLVLCWHPCLHHAGIIASIALSSLLVLRWCHCLHLAESLCPYRAGIATFAASALPPALQTGVCPTTTQP